MRSRERLGEHPHHRHDPRDRGLEAQLHAVLARRRRTAPPRAGRAAACWPSRRAGRRASRAARTRAPARSPPSARRRARESARGSPRSCRTPVESTPASTGRRPVSRCTCAARSSRSCANAEPTVPWPSSRWGRVFGRGPPAPGSGGPALAGSDADPLGGLRGHRGPSGRRSSRAARPRARPRRGRRSPAVGGRRCSCWPCACPYAPVAGVTITSPGRGSSSSASRTITSPDSQCLPASTQGVSPPGRSDDVGFVERAS